MAISEIDWPRLALEGVASLISGLAGLLLGVWRWGRQSAKQERKVQDDYDAKIETLAHELRTAMDGSERAAQARLDMLIDQFKESFAGMRRQIDDDRLHTEQSFLRKDDFKDFVRDEYRPDMRRLMEKIDDLGKG